VKSSSSTDFSASDGRKFAFPVGAAFLVLAAVLWWRERPTPMWIMAGLATLLFACGLVIPARLGPVHRGWMKMALAISKVTTPIFMSVVYFLVLTPSGLIMRLLGRRPIEHRPAEQGFWHPAKKPGSGDLERQF